MALPRCSTAHNGATTMVPNVFNAVLACLKLLQAVSGVFRHVSVVLRCCEGCVRCVRASPERAQDCLNAPQAA
eukprot:4152508-Alexandrium_andersonii.AAC.1